MKPGLSRAIPMAILGFLLGSLIVVVLRMLQSLDPIWDVGPGIVLSAITTAIFWVWGMGGFDPSMSAHGEEAEEHHEEESPDTAPPRKLLGATVWQLTTLVIIVFVVMWAFALIPGGFTLIVTDIPEASLVQVGFFTINLFGRDIQVSQLVAFAIFIIIMMGTLAVVGGGLGWLFTTLNRGVVEGRAAAAGGAPAGAPRLSAPAEPAAASASPISLPPAVSTLIKALVAFTVVSLLFYLILLPISISHAPEWITPFSILFGVLAAIFVARPAFLPRLVHIWALILFIFGVLYFIFYEVAIGLVIAQPYEVRVLVSLVNAFAIAVLLVRPSWVVWTVGMGARILLNILRALPRVLFQR